MCNRKFVLNTEDKREDENKEMREEWMQFRGQIDMPMISRFSIARKNY